MYRSILCNLLMVLSTQWLCLASFCSARQPNVLLVMTDDQGYGDLGVHGNSMIQTPTLDQFARQSLRLTDFHVEPTCAETRSALMSGQFPLRVGVWHTIMGRSIMRADAVTMPQVFQASGYRTGMFGKWHLGDNYPYRPQDRGFDVTLHHGGGGVGQTPDVWGNDYFDDVYLASGNAGQAAAENDSREERSSVAASRLTPVRGYCTDVFFRAAEEFILDDREQPFFCYLATNAPHGPYYVEESYKQPYLEQGVPEPMASFYGMISNIDDNFKGLLQLLEDQSLSRDTIVVFMTDNGTAAGYRPQGKEGEWSGFNAGMRGTKGQAYEGGHRVPCFIRFPDGRMADTEFDGLAAHVDLLPTLAGIAGIDTHPAEHLDGRNLLDDVHRTQASEPRSLVVQSHRVERPRLWTKSAVLLEDWRLIDGKELYSLKQDPGQTQDLADAHPDKVRQLRAVYEAWWRDCAPNPDQYSRIPIGSPGVGQVTLTAHDWHGPQPPWNQKMILKQPATNGYWEISVDRPGWYQFLLARQPLEAPLALNGNKAVLQIGESVQTVETHPRAVVAPITMQLEAGEFRLSTKLLGTEHGSQEVGAFVVYANYLGEQRPESAELPNWLVPGDRVAWLGGTLFERAQETGRLESEFAARAPLSGLTFCNLAWSGDDASGRARAVFGAPGDGKSRRTADLQLAQPSVVVVAYGMSEALDETIAIASFQEELQALVLEQKSAGREVVLCEVPELVVDTPATATGIDWPEVQRKYETRRTSLDEAIGEVAKRTSKLTPTIVVRLPELHTSWFEQAQYVSPAGYQAWASQFAQSAVGAGAEVAGSLMTRLEPLAVEANRLFFEMHRPQNETYLYLFRKHEQGNNGVEPPQNRPLLVDLQLRLLEEAGRPQD
ncbi:sulfatase-like hydrolase/transferase [Aureliella helgolandensis]|uniref:Arylsulfatase n=1 Tax=Aureliella helgolandensis TaxID=2527968 RepID=A0A518G2C7_9BACT|nr:sulfatase-like hydrolase/transferase [Aureliella helgolandensis]QDV22720.1 Arylsulfatase precursor [Aureliella helgolandensis]